MYLWTFLLLFTIAHAVKKRDVGEIIREKMMGIEAVHEMKIDKDTIITHNSIERKNKAKKAEETREPDWSYSAIPSELSQYVADFKRNMSECLKEVQKNDKRTVKPMSPYRESPVHGECLIACVLKRNGVIEKGKIHKENLLILVKKFFEKEHDVLKKLEKNIDRCVELSVRVQGECAMAAQLNQCTNDLMVHSKRKLTLNY